MRPATFLSAVGDTHLLEMLKPVDIQDTDESLSPARSFASLPSKTFIDNIDQPFEQTRIDELGHRVSNHGCLCGAQGSGDLFRTSRDLFFDRPLLEIGQGNTKETSGELQGCVRIVDVRIATNTGDLDVAKMKKGSK
jgi:hypothetical protein